MMGSRQQYKTRSVTGLPASRRVASPLLIAVWESQRDLVPW
jgi:hypothetical protein